MISTNQAHHLRYIVEQAKDIQEIRRTGEPVRDLIAAVEVWLSKRDQERFRLALHRARRQDLRRARR